MRARESFLDYVFSIFMNCEDSSGDHICPLLVCAHQSRKGVAFTGPGSLDQPTFLISVTRGNGQTLSPLKLEAIGLWGFSFELTGTKQEGYSGVHGFGSVGI